MDPIALTVTALAGSTTKVLKAAVDAYLSKGAREKIAVSRGDKQIELAADDLTPEMVESLVSLLRSSATVPEKLIGPPRGATREPASELGTPSPLQDKVGAWALAISPESVFADARRRMSVVFRLNFAVAIVLAVILLGGIGGAVFSAVFLKNSTWSFAFGGLSAADLLGVYVFKPLNAINASLLGTQRLEMLQLRLSQQLTACAQHKTLEKRIECQTVVWESIQRELAILAGRA